jgi:hypothetical protein
MLLLDQAEWHLSAALNVPANVTFLPLPPKCPELRSRSTITTSS